MYYLIQNFCTVVLFPSYSLGFGVRMLNMAAELLTMPFCHSSVSHAVKLFFRLQMISLCDPKCGYSLA